VEGAVGEDQAAGVAAGFEAALAEDVTGGVEQGRVGRPWPGLLAGVLAE